MYTDARKSRLVVSSVFWAVLFVVHFVYSSVLAHDMDI